MRDGVLTYHDGGRIAHSLNEDGAFRMQKYGDFHFSSSNFQGCETKLMVVATDYIVTGWLLL